MPGEIVVGLEIPQHKLPGNIYGADRNIQQFSQYKIEYAISDRITALGLDLFIDQKFFRMLITYFCAAQTVIIIQYAGEYINLFQRCQVTVQLQPDIAAKLFNFLVNLRSS